MASIGKKMIKGYPYYYARECQRVNGKPKIVWQKYLGKLEDIIKAVENKNSPEPPDEVIISQFGAAAALYDIAGRWDMMDIIDRVAGKRMQGLNVGNYMLIAAINRCVCPKSKSKIGEWFYQTPLRRWVITPKKTLTSQRFWDNMAILDTETIRETEKKLTEALIEKFHVDTRCLLYDTTNFATFIDSFNDKNTLAQRGKSKQGRSDLRIIGLALLVSSDFHVPLFHETYEGNTHDSKEFNSVVDTLVERYKVFSTSLEGITIVFDKGSNSRENFEKVENSCYHFVGSLKLIEAENLLEVPLEDYEEITHSNLPGVKAYRVQQKAYGHKRTVLVTYNEELFLTQSQCLLREIRKRTSKLKELSIQLSRWADGKTKRGKKPTKESVTSSIKEILKGQYMNQLINTEVVEIKGFLSLSYSVNHEKREKIFRQRLGKTILFTDNDSWSNAEIILAYRGQFRVEQAFATMKDPHFVSWSPMWHWNDHNVRVHAFYCVLALTLVSLLQRELYKHGIAVSITRAIEELNGIREVTLVRKEKKAKHPEPQVVLSKMNAIQQQMFDALKLKQYCEN